MHRAARFFLEPDFALPRFALHQGIVHRRKGGVIHRSDEQAGWATGDLVAAQADHAFERGIDGHDAMHRIADHHTLAGVVRHFEG